MRIGIYGGTFNPPHIGHISAAKAFLDSSELDKLLIIPTFTPPHKEYKSKVDPDKRLRMCALAFGFDGRIEISDMEIKRGGKSYTYLTLEELYNGEDELFFLVGTDMLLSLDSWVKPDRIFELSSIVYVRRETDSNITELIERKADEYRNKFGARIIGIDNSVIEISSERIRNALVTGEKRSLYLTPDVLSYIEKEGLYKNE
jgi:nicotinate-nucleotide adenylyltransferase